MILDELEDLLRKGEKEKAYELIKEDNGITADILINEGITFGTIEEDGLSISYFEFAEKIAEDNEIKEEARENLAVSYYNRGTTHSKLNKHEEAIEDFNRALEFNPKYAAAYNNRGNAYRELNKYENAIEDFNKAIELNPKYVAAYNNRGNAYRELNKYENAIEDFNKAIELNPDLVAAYYNRGLAYRELNRYEKAIEDYSRAIELNPRYAEAYTNRGTAYYELKQHERAIEDFNKAIELNPNLAEAYNNRGNAYSKLLKQHERAIEDYNKTIKLNPKDAVAYTNRGTAYSKLKQHERAIEDYNKAVGLNPEDAETYNNRGNAYHKLKQHKKAIEDYNKAIKLNPNLAGIYANRGVVRLQVNEDFDKAIEDLKCARDLFEGKDKERVLGFIEWVNAKKEMNKKNWNNFRKHMDEAREIFERISNPLSHSLDAFIKLSYLDEELDTALNNPDPVEASKEIEQALKTPPEVEGLSGAERTIFGARIISFAILHDFISSMRGIDENMDLMGVKKTLAKLYERSKGVEEMFESVNFDTGKTTIVDIQRIISSVKQEMEEIKWAANKKQKALEILKNYWSRLSSAIKMMNGVSTRETENITLGREIKSELRVGFAETKEIISKGFEKSSEEHKKILEKIYETENILMQKDVINARYRIEFPPPPSPTKIIVDIPMGKLTEKQIEEKAKEVADKIKYLKSKVKEEFLEAIKRIPVIGKELLNRLKKTKG